MAMNTLGQLLRLTTFGESHGPAIGGVLDGLPSGLDIDHARIAAQLKRRASGKGEHNSSRLEKDEVEIVSGLFEGKTTGAPLAFLIRNTDQRSEDYEALREILRPSHADLTYQAKYGLRDHRGGGRSSARETATWVVAGAIIEPWLNKGGIFVEAYVSSIGEVDVPDGFPFPTREQVAQTPLGCPHTDTHQRMQVLLQRLREEGDSIGGMISGRIRGLPGGLGEPVFGKFHAVLGQAMLSINAVKGFEIGEGFHAARLRGSQHNDPITSRLPGGRVITQSNHAGGVLGGITSGGEVLFRVAFKPVASIALPQQTIDKEGNPAEIAIRGRHDACPVPRAIPVVESLAALVTADFLLQHTAYSSLPQQNQSSRG